MYIWAPCTSRILKNDLCANGVLFQNKTKKMQIHVQNIAYLTNHINIQPMSEKNNSLERRKKRIVRSLFYLFVFHEIAENRNHFRRLKLVFCP